MEPRQAVRINSTTKDFNSKVQLLINDGIDPDEIIEKLKWDKTPFSLVRSARRNIPAEKYDLFSVVFKKEIELVSAPEEKAGLPPPEKMDKYVALLEKTIEQMEGRVHSLLRINANLEETVTLKLQTVLNNQLAQASLSEAVLWELSKMLKNYEEEPAQELRLHLHKAALQRLTALKKTGTSLQIDNEDIISNNAS